MCHIFFEPEVCRMVSHVLCFHLPSIYVFTQWRTNWKTAPPSLHPKFECSCCCFKLIMKNTLEVFMYVRLTWKCEVGAKTPHLGLSGVFQGVSCEKLWL